MFCGTTRINTALALQFLQSQFGNLTILIKQEPLVPEEKNALQDLYDSTTISTLTPWDFSTDPCQTGWVLLKKYFLC